MQKPILIAISLALASALLFLGCGGSQDAASSEANETTSSDANATTPPKENDGPLTKAKFISQADAICSKAADAEERKMYSYAARHHGELKKLSPVPRAERLIRAIQLPSILKQIEEIRNLGVPKGEAKKVEAILIAIEVGVKKARKNPYGIELEVDTQNPLEKADLLINEYGFIECRNIN